jgi:FtsP/CotA-like multicopper oxidase with cupredoxin domain
LNFLSAARDRIFLIAGQADGDYPVTINGQQRPTPATLRVGVEYRLRFIHITRGGTVDIALTQNGSPVRWRAVAKDGAELPEALRLEGGAEIRNNAGEAFDFLWTPTESGEAILSVRYARFVEVDEVVLQQKLYVR